LDVAVKNFADANVDLRTLTNYDTLLEVACKEDYIRPSDQESLSNWRKNPEAWSDAHLNN
jgi:orotate phosphoribosyltransferase